MIKEGKIVKLIGDLYTVLCGNERFDCKARGKFRNDKVSPIVGDQILFDADKNYIMEIKPRKNELKRPVIANVNYALIVTSLVKPDISYNLIDKLLCNVLLNNIKPIIVLTKTDLASKNFIKENKKILKYYQRLGIPIIDNKHIRKLKKLLKNKIVVLAGQTGAGKSTLLNLINPSLNLKTGEISEALNRGKHTTRHVEMFYIDNFYITDTPGFSALDLDDYSNEDIKNTFIEFNKYHCKFKDCNHLKDEDCGVYKAYLNGDILKSRYENYKRFIERD